MFINELFENDDMFAAKRPGKYYDSDRQPREYRVFWDQLIPASGKAETVEGEMLRAVSKIQHDFYNNGFGNNWSGALAYLQQYLPSFGVNIPHTLWNTISPYATGRTHPNNQKIENNIGLALDQITDGVMAAIRSANGNYHPNQADMYDMSSPTQWSDDEDDYDEDEDDYDEELDENADDMFATSSIGKNLDITLWVDFHIANGYTQGREISESDPHYVNAVSQIAEFLKKYNYKVWDVHSDYTDGGVLQCGKSDQLSLSNIIVAMNEAIDISKNFSILQKQLKKTKILSNPVLNMHTTDYDDVKTLANGVTQFKKFINKPANLMQLIRSASLEDSNLREEDDMFATTRVPPDAQRQIYEYGLGLLRTLEEEGTRAMQNPKIKRYYSDAHDNMDRGGTDMLFNLVLDLTGAPFEKAYVVDEWLRESGYEGLIDFGWMIEGGDYGDLWRAWDSFGKNQSLRTDTDFKQSARKFFNNDTVNENADDMFASHLDRILSKFNFPEDGPLGFMIGGGGFDDSFGGYTDGLTIVDREKQQIAFIPDFTYFDENPTQEELGELFYDNTPGFETERMPITSQMVQKVRSISEASFQFDLDDEPEPPKKTQTKDKPKFNHDPFQQQQDRPLANRQAEPPGGAAQPAAPRMRQATAANTRRAARNVAPTDQMRDMLGRMRDIEIDPDLADYPADEPTLDISTEVNTENLPAVAGQAIAAAGESSPEFHQVARLPGNMSRMIRQLGKALFGSMTNTPTEDIYMIGNLGGRGPNTRMEVNAVANFVRENGNDMGPGDIDFDAVMPGYSAQTHQYEAAGVRWLLVKDFAGEYIYAWPESDSKNTSNPAQLGNEPKRIR